MSAELLQESLTLQIYPNLLSLMSSSTLKTFEHHVYKPLAVYIHQRSTTSTQEVHRSVENMPWHCPLLMQKATHQLEDRSAGVHVDRAVKWFRDLDYYSTCSPVR